jgi:hypothetical protein
MDLLDDLPNDASEISREQRAAVGRSFKDIGIAVGVAGDRVETFERLVADRGGSWRSLTSVVESLTERERDDLDALLVEALDACRAGSILKWWWDSSPMRDAMEARGAELPDLGFDEEELADNRRGMVRLRQRLR